MTKYLWRYVGYFQREVEGFPVCFDTLTVNVFSSQLLLAVTGKDFMALSNLKTRKLWASRLQVAWM